MYRIIENIIDKWRGYSGPLDLKLTDNVVSEFGQLGERSRYLQRLERLPFSKRYIEEELEVVAEIRVIWAEREICADIHAIFKPAKLCAQQMRMSATNDLEHIESVSGGYEGLVLINDIQNMDSVEVVVPTWVWLQGVHYLDDLFSGAVYFSRFNHTLKAVRLSGEGEMNVICAIAIESDKGAGQQVKAGSDVMDRVTDDQAKGIGYVLTDRDKENTAKNICLRIRGNGIWLTVDEGADFSVEVRDVLTRSGEL